MRIRLLLAALLPLISSLASAQTASRGRCRAGVLEGEVRAGQPFAQNIGPGLRVVLDPLPSGWILRVLPATPARPAHDYAELATPPYHSVSPLLVSTDYSFRAQDAVGWTPRRFRYAPNAAAYGQLLKAYESFEATPGGAPAAQQALAEQVSHMPEGVLTVLDAHLVPGAADQAQTAANLASHFLSTAHVIEPPPDGKMTPLGRITWLRFRLALELPPGLVADRGLKVVATSCGTLP